MDLPAALPPGDPLDLLDWKRRISLLYAEVRASKDHANAWRRWRTVRDKLFRSHPQSPLPEDRRAGARLRYFEYDPACRVLGEVRRVEPQHFEVGNSDGTTSGFTRFGEVAFALPAGPATLELYWLEGYGGGLFLPFRDATRGTETYPAGRYLLDTVKGADLGAEGGRLVLDFNFAYNPSCSYDARWTCPLAPPPNWLELPVRAGELSPAK
jgi:hypothetical protein